MQRGQYLVIVLVIIVFGIALVWASRTAETRRLGTTSKTFFARSGTMRDRAQMLVSKKKALPVGGVSGSGADSEGDKVHAIKSISPEGDDGPATKRAEAIRAALLATPPEEGIQQLRALLTDMDTDAGAAEAYSALGTLYMQKEPAELDKARDAYVTALRLAATPDTRHEILYAQAMAWLNVDLRVDALDQLEDALAADETLSPALLRIRVLQGGLLEDISDFAAAERAFRQVVDQPVETFEQFGADSLDVYRQACLRLTRLYRKQSRDKEAQAVGREMRRKLCLLERP